MYEYVTWCLVRCELDGQRENLIHKKQKRKREMNLSHYIKVSIDHSLGLQISMESLQKKLRTAEESQLRLKDQYLALLSILKEKDVIDQARSEASLNAHALKKFIDENQKLAAECGNLLSQCKKWERECLLYHQDRDALMELGNESDERARDAEARVRDLVDEIGRMSEELQIRKREIGIDQVDNCTPLLEEDLLDSVLGLLVLSLVSKAKKFGTEKECIIQNLAKAKQETELVRLQNRNMDKENRKLLRQQSPPGSAETSHKSASAKMLLCYSHTRDSLKMMSSPIEKKLEFSSSPEISRNPLSLVWNYSPDSRINKK
ncbi:hypothetical protein HID58_034034 [Brassica napus]|uniref:Uncharacterized protein n=1 Tax=Brassica napus TaxID=3708 RepID=A0ABQ8C160_BRANA|nr:hypothetical protein HID58_034034 [Brassica napus]